MTRKCLFQILLLLLALIHPVLSKPLDNLCSKSLKNGTVTYLELKRVMRLSIRLKYFECACAYRNSHGYYFADKLGKPRYGVVVSKDTKGDKNRLVEVSLDSFEEDDYFIGFFIIPNGGSQNPGLSDFDELEFKEVDASTFVGINKTSGRLIESSSQLVFSDARLNGGVSFVKDSLWPGSQNWADGPDRRVTDFDDVNVGIEIDCELEGIVANSQRTLTSLRWSAIGPASGICTRIYEPLDASYWQNNYLCHSGGWELTWSPRGPIPGLNCVLASPRGKEHYWNDNALCVPAESSVELWWSDVALGEGKTCLALNEERDPNWGPNFLCYVLSKGSL